MMLVYYGVAAPEKSPSEMTLEEWAFSIKALERIRTDEQKEINKSYGGRR